MDTTQPINSTGRDMIVETREFWFPKGAAPSDNQGNTYTHVRDEGEKSLWRCTNITDK